MQLPLSKIIFFAIILSLLFARFCSANEAVECPKKITVENGKVLDAKGWSYSFDSNFLSKDDSSVIMKNGVLVSDYRFPEISQINAATNSVTGGLSYDDIEEGDNFLSLTWDIESISKTTTAVYMCDFHGAREETPIRIVYLYKAVPKHFKKCTVTYEMVEYERVSGSQKLFCK